MQDIEEAVGSGGRAGGRKKGTGGGVEARLGCMNDIVSRLSEMSVGTPTPSEIARVKAQCSSKWGLARAPKSMEILAALPEHLRSRYGPLMRAKPVRGASGIAAVAVMCRPSRCPHATKNGRPCFYCAGGVDSDFEYSTQSYTGYEPTSMRAIRARYDPWVQARIRVAQLRRLGHPADKVELIVMGGTFMSMPVEYREWFVTRLLDALSGHGPSSTVEEAVRYSEHATCAKCVGLTLETRPDMCDPQQVHDMLRYGCTRLEMGVQTIYEDVVQACNRGHTVQCVRDAFATCKEAGLKVVAHMMPDLPGVGLERDLACFAELFGNPDFRPDGIKVYPCMVMRGTQLYAQWKAGSYRNYEGAQLVDLLAKCLSLVPPWTRVYRVQRDIPLPLVTSGVDSGGNLRQLIAKRAKELGLPCRDIRTREVGIQAIHNKVRPEQVELVRRDYAASGGWETFLAYEDPYQDILIGMLRLRRLAPDPSGVRKSMIRELHVYGGAVPVHSRDPRAWQHQGYGALLVEEAERISREEHRSSKLYVISGIGTRHYYSRFGFSLDGTYMSKDI